MMGTDGQQMANDESSSAKAGCEFRQGCEAVTTAGHTPKAARYSRQVHTVDVGLRPASAHDHNHNHNKGNQG